jgi:hypothetical protein
MGENRHERGGEFSARHDRTTRTRINHPYKSEWASAERQGDVSGFELHSEAHRSIIGSIMQVFRIPVELQFRSDSSMECAECSRLVADHERLKEHSAVARYRLQKSATRRLLPGEYLALLTTANKAWLDAESARVELEQHRRAHAKAVSV